MNIYSEDLINPNLTLKCNGDLDQHYKNERWIANYD